ncbi:MAG: heat-inducible transcriptional repressor HrcA [Thermoanaerobacterales bacterium]|nr:heat-inducible transcriptional repressor HrcA [Thermoanaerobacterales bacterium]
MDERKKRILWAIIQDYIATAEPVGSRTIARKYSMGVSPATIRNEMADLEEMGYLEQPHTSAGRIPSVRGYRYYVDYLMQPEELSEEERRLIQVSFQDKVKGMAEVIQHTGQLLSRLTNYTAMVSTPRLGRTKIHNVQLIHMAPGQALLIVVLESGAVQHTLMEIPEHVMECDLATIARIFNAKIKGLDMHDIRLTLLREIYVELLRHRGLVNTIMELIEESSVSKEDKIYLGGILNLLGQPEFSSVEKVKALLSILEQEERLCSLLAGHEEHGVSVHIGNEIGHEGIQECSMVCAGYAIEGDAAGAVAVLGPTRMHYAKTVSVVDCLSRQLSHVLERIYRSE